MLEISPMRFTVLSVKALQCLAKACLEKSLVSVSAGVMRHFLLAAVTISTV